MSDPAWELPDVPPFAYPAHNGPIAEWKGVPPSNEPPGTGGGDVAGGLLINPPAGVDQGPVWVAVPDLTVNWATVGALVSLTPGLGTVKDVVEGFTGEDLFTGQHLSAAQRAINFVAAAADLLTFGEAG